jgi:hypothetical protein
MRHSLMSNIASNSLVAANNQRFFGLAAGFERGSRGLSGSDHGIFLTKA